MTVVAEQEKEMAEYGSEVSKINPSDYSCQILLEKTTVEAANDKSFPTDARLIWYVVDGLNFLTCTMTSTERMQFKKLILDMERSVPNFGE